MDVPLLENDTAMIATPDVGQTADLPDTWQGELKALLKLGVPMGFTQMAQFVIMTIDVIMIGRLGPLELAAASLGTVLYFLLWMIGMGPTVAISPLASQALGANQKAYREVRHSVRMSLWAIAFLTPFMILISLCIEPLAIFARQDPEQSAMAAKYVLALAPGLPFALGIMTLRNFLAVIEKIRVPFFLAMATTALNAGLNALLIFGLFGFPKMGLVGAGIASSISYFLCFMAYVIYIGWDQQARVFDMFKNVTIPDWPRFKEVITLAWPISMSTIFEGSLFNMCVVLMGLIGVIQVAAYQIALNVASLAFMLPWGISMAGAIRVGLAVGAGNEAAIRRAGIVTVICAVIGIGLFAIPIALFPHHTAAIYLNVDDPINKDVIKFVVGFLPFAAAFMFFDAVQVACNQLCRGLKDVKWPMVVTGISFWVIGFPTAAYLSFYTDWQANGVWVGLLVSLISASIFLSYRFYDLAWRRPAKSNPKD